MTISRWSLEALEDILKLSDLGLKIESIAFDKMANEVIFELYGDAVEDCKRVAFSYTRVEGTRELQVKLRKME